MNVSRPRIGVKMYRVSIKTPREFSKSSKASKLSKSFEQTLSKSSKFYSNLWSTSTDQILNEINYSNSKYFELSETITSTSTNRFFSLNSTNVTIKAFETFDDSIEKIDFVPKKIDFAGEKPTHFSSNTA